MSYFDEAAAWRERLLELLQERPQSVEAALPDVAAITKKLDGDVAAAEAAWIAGLRKYGLDPETLNPALLPMDELARLGRVPAPRAEIPVEELPKHLEAAPLAADAALAAQLKAYGLDPLALGQTPLPAVDHLPPATPKAELAPDDLILALDVDVASSQKALDAMMLRYGVKPEDLAKALPPHPFTD